MPTQRVLFVAQAGSVAGLFPALRDAGYEVGLADNLGGAKSFISKGRPQFIFSKAKLPGYRVEQLLAESAQAMGDYPPIIAFSEQGTAEEAARLMDLGARDYWLEPLVSDKLTAVLGTAEGDAPAPAPSAPAGPAQADRPRIQPTQNISAPPALRAPRSGDIIGRHPAVQRVLALARQVAKSRATVLISGESGTGKERFARFLHNMSDRAAGPFVAINCAALPEHLLESELFGHEKGAFTGAIGRKLGKFELASGGTILLDEISEMDLGLQAKLLRVLQEQEIDRVGGTEAVRVDTRVLATTNRRLDEYVADGKFRQDLFYRLNVIPLKLPSLRDRGDDILLLAEHFVKTFCLDYGLPELAFTAQARAWLLDYDWPGNVRELQNLMERAVLLAGAGPVQVRHFLLDDTAWSPDDATAFAPHAAPLNAAHDLAVEASPGDAAVAVPVLPKVSMDMGGILPLAEMERQMILRSLDRTQGNRTQAATLLGISVRTLRNKLAEYRAMGMEVPAP